MTSPFPDKEALRGLLAQVAYLHVLLEQVDLANPTHVQMVRAWVAGIDTNASALVPTYWQATWGAWLAELRPLVTDVLAHTRR